MANKEIAQEMVPENAESLEEAIIEADVEEIENAADVMDALSSELEKEESAVSCEEEKAEEEIQVQKSEFKESMSEAVASDDDESKKPAKASRRKVNKAKKEDDGSEKDGAEEDDKNKVDSAKARREASAERDRKIAESQANLIRQSALKSAIKAGSVIDVTIAQVFSVASGEVEEVFLSGITQNDTVITIPFSEYFPDNLVVPVNEDLSTPDGRYQFTRRKKMVADKQVHTSCSVCITKVLKNDDGTTTLVGSKKQADRKISEFFFGGAKPRISVGDIVVATVKLVSMHVLVVNVGGVDCKITHSRLTLRWLPTLVGYYKIGDEITAQVTSVGKNEDGTYSIALDPIACELERARERQHLAHIGAQTKGTVTNVYPKGNEIVIRVWLNDLKLPAIVKRISANDFGRDITAGCELRLKIERYAPNGYVFCKALSSHGNGDSFNELRY